MSNKDRAYDVLILSLDSEIATLQDIEQDRFNLWSDTGDFIRSNGLIDAYYDYLKDLLEKEEGKKKKDKKDKEKKEKPKSVIYTNEKYQYDFQLHQAYGYLKSYGVFEGVGKKLGKLNK